MMKKIICVLSIFFVMFGITGCKDTEEYEVKGTFYSLQEAYDEGLLTVENLQSIADYLNNGTLPDDVLSLSNERSIKQAYLTKILLKVHQNGTPLFPDATISDVILLGYYGTYNGAIAIRISDKYTDYGAVDIELTVEGVIFTYSGAPIIIWQA